MLASVKAQLKLHAELPRAEHRGLVKLVIYPCQKFWLSRDRPSTCPCNLLWDTCQSQLTGWQLSKWLSAAIFTLSQAQFSLRDHEHKVVFYFAGVLIVCYTAVCSAVRQPSWRDDTKNGRVGDYGIKGLGKGLWLGRNFVISSGSACRGAWWLLRVCFNNKYLTEAPSLGLAKSVCVLSGAVTCGQTLSLPTI